MVERLHDEAPLSNCGISQLDFAQELRKREALFGRAATNSEGVLSKTRFGAPPVVKEVPISCQLQPLDASWN